MNTLDVLNAELGGIDAEDAEPASKRNGQTSAPRPSDDQADPHDLVAERGLIASAMVDTSTLGGIEQMPRPVDFYDGRNATIWAQVLALRNGGGGAVDAVLLADRLSAAGQLAEVGGAAYLAEVASATGYTAQHAPHYANIIMRMAERRRLIDLGRETVRRARLPHADPGAIAHDLKANLDAGETDTRGIDYRPMTCAELIAGDFAVEYIVPNILAARQPCLVFGPQKSLKTSIVLDLAVALATGGYFLGHFRVERAAKVAMMTGESGLGTVQETISRILAVAGKTPDHAGNLIVTDRLPQFGHLDHIDAMERFIRDYELEVVVIDPAYLAMPADDSGNLFAQGALLRGMNEVVQRNGAALILLHHARKNLSEPYSPLELQHAAWAGFAEWARQWLTLNRREQYEPGTGEHRLWLSAGGSAGHNGLWAIDIAEGTRDDVGGRRWDVTVHRADEARQDARDRQQAAKDTQARQRAEEQLERDKRRVIDVLAKLPDGETKRTIRERTGMSGGRIDATIASLLDDHSVETVEIPKAGRKSPYTGYRIVA